MAAVELAELGRAFAAVAACADSPSMAAPSQAGSLRAQQALAAAKAYQRGKSERAEAPPPWVSLGREEERAFDRAVSALGRRCSSPEARVAAFRRAVGDVNEMRRDYNLIVPLLRMQKPLLDDAAVDSLLAEALGGDGAPG